MGAGGYRHAPASLPLGMTCYPLCRRLGVPQLWNHEVLPSCSNFISEIWHYFLLGKLQTLSQEYIAQQLEIVTSTFGFIHSVFCLTTGPKPPLKWFLHIVRSSGYLLKMQPKLNSLLKIAAIFLMQNDMERTHLTLVKNLFWPGLKT